MESYPRAAVERAMKVQEVILRAMAKKITWAQAGEIIGLCERQMRRWKERYEEFGYDGLFDRRTGKPSPKRVPVATVEEVLRLYREKYADFNVRHFHEKLQEQHHIRLSYTWVKRALQMAGLAKRAARCSALGRLGPLAIPPAKSAGGACLKKHRGSGARAAEKQSAGLRSAARIGRVKSDSESFLSAR